MDSEVKPKPFVGHYGPCSAAGCTEQSILKLNDAPFCLEHFAQAVSQAFRILNKAAELAHRR